jgi:Uma2 family endonuclease
MRYEEYLALGETKHHEYYDGMCVVNPPSLRHVLATKQLARLLDDHCPPGFTTYPEGGWHIADQTDVEPDLMVAPTSAAGGDVLRAPPLLVVEIESPSTRDVDRGFKKDVYGSAGAGWYWIVDLEQHRVTVFRNDGGTLVEVQRIEAEGGTTVGPFPVVVDPATLGSS